MAHSGEIGLEYGDYSGLMGMANGWVGFNPAHKFQLGFIETSHVQEWLPSAQVDE